MKRCRLSAAFGCVVAVVACCVHAEETTPPASSTVTVVPEETDAILANPGMGWETFHRTAEQDKNLPAWIPSTVHYARWGWGDPGAAARPDRQRVPRQGAARDARGGTEARLSRDVLLDHVPAARIIPTGCEAVGGRGACLHLRRQPGFRCPTSTTRWSCSSISISSSGWASATTAIPTSTMSTSAPSAGGASGT